MPYADHNKILEYHKNYYRKNRHNICISARKYRIDNVELIKEQKRKFWLKNRVRILLKRKLDYPKNKQKILTQVKKYTLLNKEKRSSYKKRYYELNKDVLSQKRKLYYQENRLKLIRNQHQYVKNRLKIDINFRLTTYLRSRLYNAIKRNYKAGSAVKDLACSISEFRLYIEKQFKIGMSWDNYGTWHIDHKVPLSYFDLSDRKQLLQACHYTNLQPMWALDNIKKSNKL